MAAKSDKIFRESRAALDIALGRIKGLADQSRSLQAAEEESGRIAEEKRSQLLLATGWAHAALARVKELPHEKFRPGEYEALIARLGDTCDITDSNSLDRALAVAEQVAAQASELKNALFEAVLAFDKRRTDAELAIDFLASERAGSDEALITSWSSTPEACSEADGVIAASRVLVEQERFEEAVIAVGACRERLAAACATAAENSGADGRRREIGGEIVSVLQEMGFDVSFEEGGRDEPMRISGLVPDVSGKGDFDISIPLDGQVDFEVVNPEGDISCVAAVMELQRRLQEQGIEWNTTDWGEGKSVSDAVRVQEKLKEPELVRHQLRREA